MLRHVFRILLPFILIAFSCLGVPGCSENNNGSEKFTTCNDGNIEDDDLVDDDAGGDDDNTDDDISDDDSANDDSGIDDDLSDDDSNDDDTDFAMEPLAIISCPTNCADVGENLHFSAQESKNPIQSPLTFRFDFGDGSTASEIDGDHVFTSPGTYRIRLTVSNVLGYSDKTSCIVSVGEFPSGIGVE